MGKRHRGADLLEERSEGLFLLSRCASFSHGALALRFRLLVVGARVPDQWALQDLVEALGRDRVGEP